MTKREVRYGTLTDEVKRPRPTFQFIEELCQHCNHWSITLASHGFCPWPGCGRERP